MLQVESTPGGGTYVNVGGLANVSLDTNNEVVVITDKTSDQFRVILDAAGEKSASISGDGFMETETNFQIMYTAHKAGTILNYRILSANDSLTGAFKVPNANRGSGPADVETFTCTLESSGPFTFA